MKGLTILNISDLALITDVSALVTSCVEMTQFLARSAKLNSASVAAIGNTWKKIQKLNISKTSVTQAELVGLVNGCPQLVQLNVIAKDTDGGISKAFLLYLQGIVVLGNLKKLEELALYEVDLPLVGIDAIAKGSEVNF
jgi:hypothetical protein